MVKLISVIAICGLSFMPPEEDKKNEKCTLSIEFNNFRNQDGLLYIFIYNFENQYPDNPYRYFEVNKKNVKNNHLLVNIPDLKHGKYAISILDDENANEDMDRFLGIPTEGYAFSNNVKPMFSLPDYDELLFDLCTSHQRLKLKMRYVL